MKSLILGSSNYQSCANLMLDKNVGFYFLYLYLEKNRIQIDEVYEIGFDVLLDWTEWRKLEKPWYDQMCISQKAFFMYCFLHLLFFKKKYVYINKIIF